MKGYLKNNISLFSEQILIDWLNINAKKYNQILRSLIDGHFSFQILGVEICIFLERNDKNIQTRNKCRITHKQQ